MYNYVSSNIEYIKLNGTTVTWKYTAKVWIRKYSPPLLFHPIINKTPNYSTNITQNIEFRFDWQKIVVQSR